MRKALAITGIVFAALLTIVLVLGIIFWFAFGGGTYFTRTPAPTITYGEFPFRLTYEVDGEIKVVEDTVICEFDGFKVVGESGKYRQWKERLKSGNVEITLLDIRESGEINEIGQTMLELYFFYGTAAYYMGDMDNPYARDAQTFEWVDYIYQNAEGKIGYSGYKADEAYEKYKIRLISWDASPPIENTFK